MKPLIAQVAPLKRMPFSRHYFDYSVPENINIKIGQLVKIPLRQKSEYGVVISLEQNNISEKIKEKLKNISEAVFEEPAISEEYFNFLKEISEMYFVSLNFILKTALPPIQKTKLTKEKIVKTEFYKKDFIKPTLFCVNSEKQIEEYLEEHLNNKGQNLILVPTVEKLALWEKKLKDVFPSREIIFIGGNESVKENFAKWFKIRNNENALVVATRSGLFCPWTRLTSIFMIDEGSFDYKSWDMAPRIQTRDAVLVLAKHSGAHVHFLTSTPSVETYFFAKNKIYEYPTNSIPLPRNQPWITDTRPEKYAGNFSDLSRAVEDAINEAAIGDVFLFLNRRGEERYLYCRNCGKTARCESCGQPLTPDKNKEKLICSTCQTEKKFRNSCPNCQSNDLIWLGLGVSGMKKILKQKFGDRYEIITQEKENSEKIETSKEKIIIGTRYAFGRLPWNSLKLVAFLDSDSSLYIPEYKATEDLWQNIHEVVGRVSEKAKIILQTENPEHPIFAFLHQPEKFYEFELKQRKMLDYPPYHFILKIFHSAKNPNEARQTGELLAKKLKNLTKMEKNVNIIGPLRAVPEKQKNLYFSIILAKINYGSYKTELKKISQILTDDWKTDPNPDKIMGI